MSAQSELQQNSDIKKATTHGAGNQLKKATEVGFAFWTLRVSGSSGQFCVAIEGLHDHRHSVHRALECLLCIYEVSP